MTKRRKEIQSQLIVTDVKVKQNDPYTMVTVTAGFALDGDEPEFMTATRFAKVHPAYDEFDPSQGVNVARGRAMRDIAAYFEAKERVIWNESVLRGWKAYQEGRAEAARPTPLLVRLARHFGWGLP